MLSIPLPPPAPLSLLLIHRAHLLPPTPPLSPPIPWTFTHTANYAIIEVHLGVLYLLLTPLTPPFLLLSPRDHLTLLTPPFLSPILQACHCRPQILGRIVPSTSSAKSFGNVVESSGPSFSADAPVVVVNSAGQSAWYRRLSPSCRSLGRIVSNYFPTTTPLPLPITQVHLPPPTPTSLTLIPQALCHSIEI